MRDLLAWGAALVFLLAAFHTVHLRRELYQLGREIGALETALAEQRRIGDNLRIELERLASPGELTRRANELGVTIGERGPSHR